MMRARVNSPTFSVREGRIHYALGALKGVGLTLRGGEILGIGGVAGNGQEDLLAALSGEAPTPPGTVALVEGPNGVGKSTLLNVAAGLLQPSRGTVESFGTPLEGLNRRAGYMFQTESLMPWRSAWRSGSMRSGS